MKKAVKWLLVAAISSVLLVFSFGQVCAQEDEGTPGPVVLWSAQGPMAVEREAGLMAAGAGPETALSTLLEGPTAEERAQGLWSAIPEGTTLAGLEERLDGAVVVRLEMAPEALRELDHGRFEIIVHQVGGTLRSLNWRELHIQVEDPATGEFVPLASFLPELPDPQKEAAPAEEGTEPQLAPAYVGQPPAPGQGQPQGTLSGKSIYVSAGHGWGWNDYVDAWRTQRPPYPSGDYDGPIIEDHNNAEAVNQYLLQYLWNAGAMVWPVRERDTNGVEVIVDNDAPAAGTGYFETGSWTTTSFAGTGYAGTDYRYATTETDTATATAVWTATLPTDDRYAVYVWYRHGSNRAPDARYTVHHAGGTTDVVVDQQIHGDTWHYLGTYGFLADEGARVTLSNRSTEAGVVIADAVRFGGGTFNDLSGVETIAPDAPDKPWWEVAAFYHTQRMGMEQPPGDVTARPLYARWEHEGTGDDAVYVSWHSNGYTGYPQDNASGTESYVHITDTIRTEGSLELQDAVHTELIEDLRAGWDPNWVDRGQKRANFGELRALWDDDEEDRMPGVLVELAYHDHPTDTNALKEPTFNMLAARAMYQGIVKYFEQRDGIDLTLLPEPPTHLAVRNVGGGCVRVSWRPSPTDTLDLAGDPATGYRVYTSTNGIGWSNGVDVTDATDYTLSDLAAGQLLYVRVTATNAGGESFPTETLAVRVGDGAEVLLVNGFDRLNRTMTVADYDSVEGKNMRVDLSRMNRYDYVIQHAEVISYTFDSASNEAVSEALVQLGDYAIVDWILGEESAPDETLDATERELLADFMDGGGALFISGSEIGWDLDYLGSADERDFYGSYLRADYAGDDAESYDVVPVSGSIFEGLELFRFDAPQMYAADYPDRITVANGSQAALRYYSGVGGTAAVQYADGLERLVYFGFPFETIRAEARSDVMERVLAFLSACSEAPSGVEISRASEGDLFVGSPVRFTAEADGERPFSYAWTLDGDPIGEDKSTLDHQFDAPGTYTIEVTVSNACGRASAAKVVEVKQSDEEQPDLSQSRKSVNLTHVEGGDILTYTLLLRNRSATPAAAILTDAIPAHTDYVAGSARSSDDNPVTATEQAVVWSGTVISGTPVAIEFAVEVMDGMLPGTPITNVARLDDGLGNVVLLEAESIHDPGYSISINDGALYTNIPTVTLNLLWRELDPPITWMKISNDGGFGASTGWINVGMVYDDWALEIYKDESLLRNVYVMFRDSNGTQYGPVRDDIVYDSQAPRVTGMEVITDGVQSLAATEEQTAVVRVTGEDGGSGLDKIQLSDDWAFTSPETFDVDGSTTEIEWTLQSSGEVYVRVIDRAGNMSAVESNSDPFEVYLPLVVRR